MVVNAVSTRKVARIVTCGTLPVASHERGASLTWAAAIKKWTVPLVTLENVIKATGTSKAKASASEKATV
jgi:hypothetical protein